jgi:hypothetical protein
MKYTSIDRIYSKVIRDLGINADEADLIEWTGEALEAIDAQRSHEEAVAFLQVKNYHCEVPFGLQYIIQVAKNTRTDTYAPIESDAIEENAIVDPEGVCPVRIDCNGAPIDDHELSYYRPYYDLRYEYDLWRDSTVATRYYEPVRLAVHSFFNSIVCGNVENNELYKTTRNEYSLTDEDSIMRFSFSDGLVALAYVRTVLDTNGIPKIPDNYSFVTAVVKYITYKLMERQFYLGKSDSDKKVYKAEKDWQWYCKQAKNSAFIIQGIDEMENYLDQRTYLIPRRNVYDSFFGNLAKRENKNILNTYQRHNSE